MKKLLALTRRLYLSICSDPAEFDPAEFSDHREAVEAYVSALALSRERRPHLALHHAENLRTALSVLLSDHIRHWDDDALETTASAALVLAERRLARLSAGARRRAA